MPKAKRFRHPIGFARNRCHATIAESPTAGNAYEARQPTAAAQHAPANTSRRGKLPRARSAV